MAPNTPLACKDTHALFAPEIQSFLVVDARFPRFGTRRFRHTVHMNASLQTAVVPESKEIDAISVAWRDQTQSALEISLVCAGATAS